MKERHIEFKRYFKLAPSKFLHATQLLALYIRVWFAPAWSFNHAFGVVRIISESSYRYSHYVGISRILAGILPSSIRHMEGGQLQKDYWFEMKSFELNH